MGTDAVLAPQERAVPDGVALSPLICQCSASSCRLGHAEVLCPDLAGSTVNLVRCPGNPAGCQQGLWHGGPAARARSGMRLSMQANNLRGWQRELCDNAQLHKRVLSHRSGRGQCGLPDAAPAAHARLAAGFQAFRLKERAFRVFDLSPGRVSTRTSERCALSSGSESRDQADGCRRLGWQGSNVDTECCARPRIDSELGTSCWLWLFMRR